MLTVKTTAAQSVAPRERRDERRSWTAAGPGPDSMIEPRAIGQKASSQQLPSVLLRLKVVKLLRVCQQDSCSHVEGGVASGRAELIRLQIST